MLGSLRNFCSGVYTYKCHIKALLFFENPRIEQIDTPFVHKNVIKWIVPLINKLESKALILTNHPNHPPTAGPSYFPLQPPSQPAYYLLLIILELLRNKKCQ